MVLEWLCQNLVVALCFLGFYISFIGVKREEVLSINEVGGQLVVAGDRRVK